MLPAKILILELKSAGLDWLLLGLGFKGQKTRSMLLDSHFDELFGHSNLSGQIGPVHF